MGDAACIWKIWTGSGGFVVREIDQRAVIPKFEVAKVPDCRGTHFGNTSGTGREQAGNRSVTGREQVESGGARL